MKLVTCRFVGGPEGAGMKYDAIQYTPKNAHLVISRLHHALVQLLVRKALSHDAIFHATCNAILLLGDVKVGKYKFPSRFADIFLTYQTFVTNLHLLRVELRCKLQEKLHRVTGP